jgi:hypothetical protein
MGTSNRIPRDVVQRAAKLMPETTNPLLVKQCGITITSFPQLELDPFLDF